MNRFSFKPDLKVLSFAAVSLVSALSFGQTEAGIASSPATAKPISVGTKAPGAHLWQLDGKATSLASVLKGKKSVVIFYRGDWCPFCNTHLADLGKIQGDLKSRGYQIVAISPDGPKELTKTLDKNKLTYQLYSDATAEAMKAFGVAYRLDDDTFNMYRSKYNVDLERSSGYKHHALPVPSVFLVNAKGIITYVHANPDYRVRLKGEEVLAAVDHK